MKPIRRDFLIVGGGIAGVTAAETIRKHDPYSSIAILSLESLPLYSRVMLPSYVRGKLSREQVFLRTRADYEKNGIELWLGEEVIALDVKKSEVHTRTGKFFNYGKLLLSSGGTPLPWYIEDPGIMRLHTIEDADRLRAFLIESPVKEALVVGGGFIGLELVESFVHAGFSVGLVLKDSHLFSKVLDSAGAALLEENMKRNGVSEIYRDSLITFVERDKNALKLIMKNGNQLLSNVVGLGIGLMRTIEAFRGEGIKTGPWPSGGIYTDEYLRTDVENIFAAGDVAECYDVIFSKRRILGTWTNAFIQGRVAGENMVGIKTPFRHVSSYSISHLGFHITFLGECAVGDSTEAFSRTWSTGNTYERFFFEGSVLKGAALINRFQDKTALVRLIDSRHDLTAVKDAMRDPDFDVNSLVNS